MGSTQTRLLPALDHLITTVAEFARWGAAERRWSLATQAEYSRWVVVASRFLAERGIELPRATTDDLKSYVHNPERRGHAPRTLDAIRVALVHYFNFLISTGMRDDNPAVVLSKAESEDDATKALLSALRDLHRQAGEPTPREMAKGVTPETVANALTGKHFPSWRVVKSLVERLGGNEQQFLELWKTARRERFPSGHSVDSIEAWPLDFEHQDKLVAGLLAEAAEARRAFAELCAQIGDQVRRESS